MVSSRSCSVIWLYESVCMRMMMMKATLVKYRLSTIGGEHVSCQNDKKTIGIAFYSIFKRKAIGDVKHRPLSISHRPHYTCEYLWICESNKFRLIGNCYDKCANGDPISFIGNSKKIRKIVGGNIMWKSRSVFIFVLTNSMAILSKKKTLLLIFCRACCFWASSKLCTRHERVNVADLWGSVVVVVKYVLRISDSDVFNIRFLVNI